MYCTWCGTENADAAAQCVQCGRRLPDLMAASAWPETIRNYLAEAIVVTLCCCQPLGIVAIVFAAQVSGKVAAGDVPGAIVASNRAKTFTWLGFGAGLLIALVYLVIGALGVLSEQT